MSDPQNFGLGELGQRLQAMSDPAPEPRLRPYQGSSQSTAAPASSYGTVAGGRPVPIWETETPAAPASSIPSAPPASAPPYTSYYSTPAIPAPPEPYPPLRPASSSNGLSPDESSNGSAHGALNGAQNGSFNAAHSKNFTGSDSSASSSGYGSKTATPPATAPVSDDPNTPKSGLQRAVDAVRSALPLVQKLLPLLDSTFASTVTVLVTPHAVNHPQPPPTPPAQIHVDLEPVERGLAEVRTSHRELRSQVVEQATSLKRVEDQLERVREATDRNTLEQQELVEDLRTVGGRISTFAVIGLVILIISMGLNIYFLVQLQHILR